MNGLRRKDYEMAEGPLTRCRRCEKENVSNQIELRFLSVLGELPTTEYYWVCDECMDKIRQWLILGIVPTKTC